MTRVQMITDVWKRLRSAVEAEEVVKIIISMKTSSLNS